LGAYLVNAVRRQRVTQSDVWIPSPRRRLSPGGRADRGLARVHHPRPGCFCRRVPWARGALVPSRAASLTHQFQLQTTRTFTRRPLTLIPRRTEQRRNRGTALSTRRSGPRSSEIRTISGKLRKGLRGYIC